MAGNEVINNGTVIIKDNRIYSVGDVNSIKIPKDAEKKIMTTNKELNNKPVLLKEKDLLNWVLSFNNIIL